MPIRYFPVLGQAWRRAHQQLFGRFEPRAWLGLGLCAWLATLGESVSSHCRYVLDRQGGRRALAEFDSPGEWARSTYADVLAFFDSGLELALVLALALAGLLVALLVTWLSSRGHFMLLDNVVSGRSQVADPWRRQAGLGDSLFLWRLGFGAVSFLLVGGVLAVGLVAAIPLLAGEGKEGVGPFGLIGLGLGLLALVALLAFVEMLLYHFVVPVMYTRRLGVLAAWGRFLGLLRTRAADFVLYALFLLLLGVLLGVAVAVALLATCCVSWLLVLVLGLPVIGATLLLPLHVTWRLLGPEFLAQFGPEWRALPPR